MKNPDCNNHINICDLQMIYKRPKNTELVVFDKLNLTFELGKKHCIMGASGCGKSTLINIISGYEKPTNGTVFINDHEKLNSTDVGVVFQDNVLFPWKTVLQNLRFGLRMRGIHSKEATDISLEYLNHINMLDVKDCYPHELSGGMQQRIALLRVILYNPKLIILDEAFSALDFLTRWKMQTFFLDRYKEQKFTSIVTTHDVNEAIRLSDVIYIFTGSPMQCKKIITNNLSRQDGVAIERNNEYYALLQEITNCLRETEEEL